MVRIKHILLAGAAIGAFAVSTSASAESLFTRDRNVSVTEREREGYEPLGIRMGSFVVHPRVDLTAAYTDNVFAISTDVSPTLGEQSDTYFILRPSFQSESDWNRHSLQFGGYVEGYQHVDFDDENIFNAGANIDGRVDVTRAFSIVGGLAYDQLHESRKATSVVATPRSPIEYDLAQGYLGTQHEWGRFRARSRVDLKNYDFKNAELITGGTTDQSFRDRLETRYEGELGYAVTRDAAVFVRAGYNTRDYDTLTGAGLNRDSDGYTISTGVDFDISRLARGSIALGYMEQSYDDPALSNVSGVSVDAGVEWFPTQLTTVTLSATRDVRESPLFNTGGYAASEAILRVDQEVARNVLAYASIGYGQDEYEDVSRTDERYGAAVGVQWLINRVLSAKAEYVYEDNQTDQPAALAAQPGFFGKDYTTNEFFVTLTAQR